MEQPPSPPRADNSNGRSSDSSNDNSSIINSQVVNNNIAVGGKNRPRRRSFSIGFLIASSVIFAFFILPQQYAGITNNEIVGDKKVTVVHHNLTTTPTSHDHDIIETVPVTIVCQLSGEMANNLGKLGHCLSLKYWLERGEFYNSTHKLGYNARIAIRHQDNSKWVKGYHDLQKCFPNTKQYDFSEANNDQFDEIYKTQQTLIKGGGGRKDPPPFNDINAQHGNLAQIKAGMQSFVSKVAEHHGQIYNKASKRNISIPFLYANRIQDMDPLNDMFYNQLKSFFRFNYKACCKIRAEPDESVFHFRNFKQEMPKKWNSLGFHEASPEKAATKLFGHLKEGEKVVIVTRFSGKSAQEYVDAFRSRNLTVRVVDGQHGTQDFCLLMSAQKEIIGTKISTYLLWAGYLGNATRVVAYQMKSSRKTHRVPSYNFTSPVLKRFEFPIIQ